MAGELTLDEILKTIEALPPFSGKRIAISGGEPAVRKDCGDIVEYAAVECGHDVDLYTNGKNFPEALARRIVEINAKQGGNGQQGGNVRLQVSLEGAIATTSDQVRGEGSFADAMKTLRRFQEMGLNRSVVLFICITKNNIHEIDAMIKLAEDLDVAMLVFSQWQKQGNAGDTPWAELAPSVDEWVAAGEKLIRYKNPRLQLHGNFHGDLGNNELGRYSLDNPRFPKHTYFYNSFPRITPQGDVLADQLWVDPDWIVGNIRKDDLDACFETPKFYSQLEDMRARLGKVPECQACEWRNLCECGSPGHTYAEYGHMNAKDLFCESRIYWFNRYVEHQTERAFPG
jgi:radical SAM protein with 4Fe4S-binding SPASM domain